MPCNPLTLRVLVRVAGLVQETNAEEMGRTKKKGFEFM